jgi:hypothetical protein
MNVFGTNGAMAGCQCAIWLNQSRCYYHKWTKLISLTYRLTTAMVRGQAVSEPIQWIIIRLSAVMAPDEISGFTDISDRKVRDILAHFKKTGGTKVSKREPPTLHNALQDEDIQVLFIFSLLGYTHLYC